MKKKRGRRLPRDLLIKVVSSDHATRRSLTSGTKNYRWRVHFVVVVLTFLFGKAFKDGFFPSQFEDSFLTT
jgi:hypothetical protein